MNQDQDPQATRIAALLAKAPGRRAPSTLLPRVLEEIELRSRPWYQRPVVTWDPAARSALLVAATALTASVALGANAAVQAVTGAIRSIPGVEAASTTFASLGGALASAGSDSLRQPVVLAVVAVLAAAILVSGGIGAATLRLAMAVDRNR